MGSIKALSSRLLNDYEDRRREHTKDHIANVVRTINKNKPRVVNVNIKGRENALDHHCDDFEIVSGSKNTAVIRRGGIFNIEVEMNQDIDLKNKHEMYIILSFGHAPFASKGTQAALKVTGKKTFDRKKDFWDSRLVTDSGNKADIQIRIPSDVPVGIWKLRFDTKAKNTDDYQSFKFRGDIYILFNPWNPDDDVYLEDEKWREEYVMNDVGKMWSLKNIRRWVFGQFDDVVLPVCEILLGISGLADEDRGDCVKVSRAISKMVNSHDENYRGLLSGKWKTPYFPGTAPGKWTGSIKIMEEYMETKKSVNYGQCWVFSGAVTTICRALGIPCRNVSNMESGHDTNNSLTIDRYYYGDSDVLIKSSKQNSECLSGIGDTIWNYHMWNDVWMVRRDLPPGYGGWQVIDGTPQELSYKNYYQCGPASVLAIQKGEVNLKYDVGFIVAEVNADIVFFKVDNNNRKTYVESDIKHVGKILLTQAPGGKLDCTANYKFSEGHRREREALKQAIEKNHEKYNDGSEPECEISPNEKVRFELEEVEDVLIGQDFSITVKLNNTSSSRKTVSVVMKASSQYYTGEEAEHIRKSKGEFVLEPRERTALSLLIKFKEYYDELVEQSIIKMEAMCSVKETSQNWMSYKITQLTKPSLFMKVLESPSLGTPFSVLASFKNPLDKNLRNCTLSIDGPGLTKPQILDIGDVDAGEEIEYDIELIARNARKKTLVAIFNSMELQDVAGEISIQPRQ